MLAHNFSKIPYRSVTISLDYFLACSGTTLKFHRAAVDLACWAMIAAGFLLSTTTALPAEMLGVEELGELSGG